MERDTLLALIEAHLDGQLTDRDRLNRALAESAEARRLFWECVHLRVELRALHDEEAGANLVGPPPVVEQRAIAPARRSKKAALVVAATLLAAALVVWVAVTRTDDLNRPAPSEVARIPQIERVAGTAWLVTATGRTPVAIGDAVELGTEIRTGGGDSEVVVRFPGNTRVTLARNSVSRLAGPAVAGYEVELSAGSLFADSAGGSLRVRTPHATAELTGTALYTGCSADSTQIGLDVGAVRVTRTDDGSSARLVAGESVVVSSVRGPLETFLSPRRVTRPLWQLDREVLVNGLATHPTRPVVAVADVNGSVELRDLATGRLLRTLGPETEGAISLAYTVAGDGLLVGRGDGRVLRFAAGDYRSTVSGPSGDRRPVCINPLPGGDRLEVYGNSSKLLIEAALVGLDGRKGTRWNLEKVQTTGVAAHPKGLAVVAGTRDRRLLVSESASPDRWTELPAPGHTVTVVAFSPDGATFATGDTRGVIRVRRWPGGEEGAALRGHLATVRSLRFISGGLLVSGSDDDTARVWDLSSGRELATLEIHRSSVVDLAVGSDGRTLLTGAREKRLAAWSLDEFLPPKKGAE